MRDLLDTTQRLDFDSATNFKLFADDADPVYFEDACKEKKWRHAMDDKIKSIMKNDSWDLSIFLIGINP